MPSLYQVHERVRGLEAQSYGLVYQFQCQKVAVVWQRLSMECIFDVMGVGTDVQAR